MHRLIIAILTALVIGIAAAPASAGVGTAEQIAQAYQLQQCKDIGGILWHCYNSRAPAQSCDNLGNPYYNCVGVFTQQWLAGGLHECKLDVYVQKGTGSIIFHYNTCLH